MSYYGFVVTDSGRELIAKLVAGQQLPISKIMVGSGTIPDDVKPRWSSRWPLAHRPPRSMMGPASA